LLNYIDISYRFEWLLTVGLRDNRIAFMFNEKFPLFVLSSLRSAFNVGSVFRTAESVSPAGVVLAGISARPGGKKVGRTSRGTHGTVPWRWFQNAADAVRYISMTRVVVAAENTPDAIPLHLARFPANSAFILGNEADGISDELLDLCTIKIVIPQSGSRSCINVSSTAAMIAWEIQRRRLTGEEHA
jgi:tRNA G18 (ribose-2'-O)-methylase SpoU